MISVLKNNFIYYQKLTGITNYLQPIALLMARFYVAWVFFSAGLTKIKDWESTLFLFEEEYFVPFLPFELAAYLGTFAELFFPVLLVIGLATRFASVSLFMVNIVAVISLEEIAPAALYLHVLWGLLMLQAILWGAGKLSADHLLKKIFTRVC
jgi:putative oxidoreductase